MQRVAIARALVRRPKALLMDEPIGALDAKLREGMRAELKRLHIENSATTVYVTHDQVEAMALADRIAIMNEGVLQQVGAPAEVYRNPANLFVAQFVGSPVMNVVEAVVMPHPGRGGPARRRRWQPSGSRCAACLRRSEQRWRRGHTRRSPRRRPGSFASLSSTASRMEAHFIEPLGAYDIVDLKLGRQFSARAQRRGFVPGRAIWSGWSSTRPNSTSSIPRRATPSDTGAVNSIWPRQARNGSSSPSAAIRHSRSQPRDRGRTVLRAPWADGCREDDDAAADRRAGEAELRLDQHRSSVGRWLGRRRARRGARLAAILAVSALHRASEPRVSAEVAHAPSVEGRDRRAGRARCARSCASSTCSSARPTGSRAGRCSASRSAARSFAARRSF